jgi:hypothetical protein
MFWNEYQPIAVVALRGTALMRPQPTQYRINMRARQPQTDVNARQGERLAVAGCAGRWRGCLRHQIGQGT